MSSSIHDLISWRLSGLDQPQRPGLFGREPSPLASLKQDIERLMGTEDEPNWRLSIRRIGDRDDAMRKEWRLGEVRIFPRRGVILCVSRDAPSISRHVYVLDAIETIEMSSIVGRLS